MTRRRWVLHDLNSRFNCLNPRYNVGTPFFALVDDYADERPKDRGDERPKDRRTYRAVLRQQAGTFFYPTRRDERRHESDHTEDRDFPVPLHSRRDAVEIVGYVDC